MNIHKIIRSYFAFICMISTVALLTVNDGFNNSFVSVFHSSGNMGTNNAIEQKTISSHNSKYILSEEPVNLFVLENESLYTYSNDSSFEAFKAKIKSKKDLNLNNLSLSLDKISTSEISKATLYINGIIADEIKPKSDKINFTPEKTSLNNGINTISVQLQLVNKLTPGRQFRLSINSPNDIDFDTSSSLPNTFYPIYGKYITAVSQKI